MATDYLLRSAAEELTALIKTAFHSFGTGRVVKLTTRPDAGWSDNDRNNHQRLGTFSSGALPGQSQENQHCLIEAD